MTPLDELVLLTNERGRRVFVAEFPIDLARAHGNNSVYILELPSSAPGVAGGRISGIGDRRVLKLLSFRQVEGKWMKVFESEDQMRLNALDLPYHATGLPVVLPDGSERIVAGVVDQELVSRYNKGE